MLTKRLLFWAGAVVLILAIPFIAMQYTAEVNWDVMDFAIMGLVLMAMALAYELIARRSDKSSFRAAFGIGLLGALLLFWVNAAVGIIGNEGQPANLLYIAVFIVGFLGSFLSRFRARGMAITLFVVAAVQLLVPIVAYLIWPPPVTSWSPSVVGVFLLSGFFAVLFLLSGFLFKHAIPARTLLSEQDNSQT